MNDLAGLFVPSLPPVEIFVRGTVVYLSIFLLFRFVLRRGVGSLGIADILLITLIADASQSALSGDGRTIADGLLVVGTIVAWNIAIDWLTYRYPLAQRILETPPLPLVRSGRIQRANLRRQFVTDDDLRSMLREAGVEDIATIKRATLEPDGKLSVIRYPGK